MFIIKAKTFKCNGKNYTLKELSEKSGVSVQGVYYRIQHGWSIDKIISTPKQESIPHRCIYNGKEIGVSEVSQLFGLTKDTIYQRIHRGDTLQDVVDNPIRPKGNGLTKRFRHKGKITTFKELSKETGLSLSVLRQRYLAGKRNNALVDKEKGTARIYRIFSYKGKKYNMCELSRLPECKVSLGTLRARIHVSGWPVEEAVEIPLIQGWKGTARKEAKT